MTANMRILRAGILVLAMSVTGGVADSAAAGARDAGDISGRADVVQLVSPLAAVAEASDHGGEGEGVAFVDRACPTFSWATVEGATGYEVRIFELSGDPESDGAVVASATVAAGALTWTPAGNRCLVRGVLYGWKARALFSEAVESAAWSKVAPFRLEIDVSPAIVRALAVALASEAGVDAAEEELDENAEAAGLAAEGGPFGEGAALRGEALATSGDVAGAVGTNISFTGAGIGAAHAGAGVDLLLDGSADGAVSTHLRHDSLDRPDAAAQTFAFENSLGWGILLLIDNRRTWTSDVAGSGNLFDADLLLGRSSADLAAWNHHHDALHYPDSELATDSSATVDWSHLTPGPSYLTDGDITQWDSRFGNYLLSLGSSVTAIAATRGQDGLPVIAVKLASGQGRVIFCDDLRCSTHGLIGLVGSGAGDRISVIPSNPDVPGSVLVAAETGADTTLLQLCSRTTCTTARTFPLRNPVVVPGPAGFPLLFGVQSVGGLVVSRVLCTSWNCDTGVLIPGGAGLETEDLPLSAVVFPNSNPMVAYRSDSLDRIKFYYCNDQCGGIHGSSFEQGTSVGSGRWPVLAIAQNGGLLLADRFDSGGVRFTNCQSYSCLGGNILDLPSTATSPSVALGEDGSALFSVINSGNLIYRRCADPDCAVMQSVNLATASDGLAVMMIGGDGLPFFAIADGGGLRVVHCSSAACRQNGAN